jgi:hypothetical protein
VNLGDDARFVPTRGLFDFPRDERCAFWPIGSLEDPVFQDFCLIMTQPLEHSGDLVRRRHELLRIVGEDSRCVEFALLGFAGNDRRDHLECCFFGREIDVGLPLLEIGALRIVAADAVQLEDWLYVLLEIDRRRCSRDECGKQRGGEG